jgi:hypothetical protein
MEEILSTHPVKGMGGREITQRMAIGTEEQLAKSTTTRAWEAKSKEERTGERNPRKIREVKGSFLRAVILATGIKP